MSKSKEPRPIRGLKNEWHFNDGKTARSLAAAKRHAEGGFLRKLFGRKK